MTCFILFGVATFVFDCSCTLLGEGAAAFNGLLMVGGNAGGGGGGFGFVFMAECCKFLLLPVASFKAVGEELFLKHRSCINYLI